MSRKIEIIENINNAHCDIFLKLEEKLRNHNIESIEEAEKLSKKAERFGDIETADIDLVWGELWNKPLYSYTNEKNGEKWRKQLEKFGIQNGSARIDIAMDPQKILGLKEKGVVDAAKEININVPLVVRLAGTNFKEGKEILDNSGLKLISAENLDDAAKKIVEAIK